MAGELITNFDYAKIFIWSNRFRTASYTNSTGATVELKAGRIIGRVNASNKVLPQVSTATDGSQVPMGILQEDYSVANGATVEVSYCVSGDVAREKLILGGSDTLATVISLTDSGTDTVDLGTIDDILIGKGILTVSSTENTAFDNQ